nr:PREDICTED: protein lifeguard 3-like isoform X2 [Paralichthys olivaceus]
MSSKVDSPPSYEDAVQQPKYGNYPQQPQHGSPLPPPPSYSPSPSMFPGTPGYWGQEGIHPRAAMWAAAPGFSPSGTPSTIPTLSAGVPASNSGDMGDLLSAQWESTSIRHGFIRKVYLILTAQLAVTFSVVGVFTFVDPVRLFVIRYPGIYWASFVVYFLVYCILICCKEPRRRFPCNLVLLGIFVDFTSCGGLLSVAAVLLMIIGIVTAVVLSFQYVPWLHMLYAAIGAVVYTLFLVYNTQLLIGNRELAISPEEYIYGALSLYVDIVHIFLFILQISGAATE